MNIPDTCPTCAAPKSHDVPHLDAPLLLGRVYDCGAAVSTNAAGAWFSAIACPNSAAIIAQLRADNARLGAMNVTLAAELQAIADAAEEQLDDWMPVVLEQLPGYLHFARTVYDLAVEALEGQPSAPAAEAAPVAPDHGLTGVEQASAAGLSGERSLVQP